MAHPATRKLKSVEKLLFQVENMFLPWRLYGITGCVVFPRHYGSGLVVDCYEFIYSKGNFSDEASTVSCHTLGRTSRIRMGRQFPVAQGIATAYQTGAIVLAAQSRT